MFVKTLDYRQSSWPTHSRRAGHRDRPFDLTVDFEEGRIDDLLKAAALKTWLSRRQRLAVFVAMEQGAKKLHREGGSEPSPTCSRERCSTRRNKAAMEDRAASGGGAGDIKIHRCTNQTPSFPAH